MSKIFIRQFVRRRTLYRESETLEQVCDTRTAPLSSGIFREPRIFAGSFYLPWLFSIVKSHELIVNKPRALLFD